MEIGYLIGVLFIIASFLVISYVVYLNFVKEDIEGYGEELTCRISFIQSSDISKLKCDVIPVEIESDNPEKVREELLGLINNMFGDFALRKKFSENAGVIFKNTFCKRRYDITFKNDLEIGNFKTYLNMRLPEDLKNRVQVIPSVIDTSKVYTLVLVVVSESYFNTWWNKGVTGFVKAVFWKGVDLDYIGFALVDEGEKDKLRCDNTI